MFHITRPPAVQSTGVPPIPWRRLRLALLLAAVTFVACPQASEAQEPIQRHTANSRIATAAPLRSLMHYVSGAWLTPVATILTSSGSWSSWSAEMLLRGRSVGYEEEPAGVDWRTEAVLVVSLGEVDRTAAISLCEANRWGTRLRICGKAEWGCDNEFSTPCHVVAFPRRWLGRVTLDPRLPLPPLSIDALNDASTLHPANQPWAPSTSWGRLKARYR